MEQEQQQTSLAMQRKPEVLHALDRAKPQIISRLPQGIEPERFFLSIATCIQKNTALLNCEPNSVLLAAYEASDLGVSLSPTLQLGYLIPYGRVAQFQLSYRGMIQKAYETGAVKNFFAEVVYSMDEFRRELAPRRNLVHIPCEDEDRGEPIGAYALVEFHDGHIEYEYLTAKQIDKHKKKSKQQNSMMWSEFWEEAWRKTAIRVLAKRLPLGNEKFERLVEQINREAERETDLTPPPAPPPKQTTTATLKAKLKSSGSEINKTKSDEAATGQSGPESGPEKA